MDQNYLHDLLQIKWGASSQCSSSLYCPMRNSNEMVFEKRHPSLLYWIRNQTPTYYDFEILVFFYIFGYQNQMIISWWNHPDAGATHKNSKLKGLWCTKYVTLVSPPNHQMNSSIHFFSQKSNSTKIFDLGMCLCLFEMITSCHPILGRTKHDWNICV